ncbi:MAG: ATP-binding cassette domain-containing protein [Cyclobacteriaceae bacterium]|nr:ATP-binding cassette domain-containing protein [Cyclobacteriaceae bacterium HetDA_MAG_MS6]
MSESIVNALVHLFAIFESVKESFEQDSGKIIVKPYLEKTLNQELTNEYLKLFYDYLSFYKEANLNPAGNHELGIDSTSIIQIAKICNQLAKELEQSQRITVFIQLLELIQADDKVSAKESEFASLVAMNLNLEQKEVKNIKSFIFDKEGKEIDHKRGLEIDNKMTEWPEEVAWMMRKKVAKVPGASKFRHMYVENFYGRLLVLQIESVETFVFKYEGPLNLYLEGNKIIPKKAYFLKPGSIIKGPNIESIYETEITKQFLKDKTKVKIVLSGEDLEFHFKNSSNGIQKFNFSEESGHLVGIMGGSGTGKSTLINLLNGKIEPSKGRVHINGHSIQRAGREGVIGYVPQDDLLFEELSVYQNLYFNAQTCFSDFSPSLIEKTVNKVLEDLDLLEIKDLQVGDPLNKTISGGQRKRLNIALELMREPAVLFVDEPTSGLSSMDSEKVMWLLKDLARKGKLVIAIIHQPSSDIFKLLDKLWLLDKGGFPIYNGNPIDAVVYFKTMSTQVNAAESECQRCGNVIPEQVLQIIEAKEIDDKGNATSKRRVSPKNWYVKYRENIESKLKRTRYDERLPPSNFNIPGRLRQLTIFSHRNFLSKLANKQYILINLFQPPVLALILGYFSKYTESSSFVFADNKNLPVFLFMSVVVSLFMGMSVSAEEIFKDRRILERESFLNLSRISYLNSKILFLFGLSALQTILFVSVGSLILEIKGLGLLYWVILFSTSCFANLVGLNISSALNSIITIYILIPFILVPQLLLGGAMIRFDDLHQKFTNKTYVPVVGDLMVSRWSYEALAVAQFKHNKYQKYFYDTEKEMSDASFQTNYTIPRIEGVLQQLSDSTIDYQDYAWELALLRNEIRFLTRRFDIRPFPLITSLNPDYFNAVIGERTKTYFENLKREFRNQYSVASARKDSIYQALVDELGKESFNLLKQDYFNKGLNDIVTNRTRLKKISIGDAMLVQKKDPIYMEPYSDYGRAHFYSPIKRIADWRIDTVWFNVLVIWLFTGVLYFMLIHDTFRQVINFFSGRRVKNKKH